MGYCPDGVHLEEERVQVQVHAEEEIRRDTRKGTRRGKKERTNDQSRTHGSLCGRDEECANT